MSYNFKLEKVLNYKESMEDVKKGEYGEVSDKLKRAESKLLKYKNNKATLIDEKENMGSNTKVGNLKLYNEYLKSILNDIKQQEELVFNIKEELNQTKEELMKAMQEKKTLEKLKEKSYNEFIKESNKAEEKVIDALNSFNGNARN